MTDLSRREFVWSLAAAAGVGPRGMLRGLEQPYALVLGAAQDGGFPQTGCYSERCNRARARPRFVASLGLIEPESRRYYLVDATPDITRQMDLIAEEGFRARANARRPFDGIFLTHAHIGHYLGLALLGRESLGISETPVYCTPAMRAYLSSNGPWSLMVDEGRLIFPDVPVDAWFDVDGWLRARMIPVPHRPEFSDTVGWMFEGPAHSVFYLPDIDRWEAWDRDIRDVVRTVDVSLLDASFYSGAEIPGRRIEDIPHPLVPHSMDLLESAVSPAHRVMFTHFNNTNPVHDDGPERAEVLRRGFELAEAGTRIPL